MRRHIVLVVKSKFKSIQGLGFSEHTQMMVSKGDWGSPLIRFIIKHRF